MATIKDFEGVLAANNDMVDAEWNGIKFKIKPTLSIKESMEFINNVIDSCFSDDTGEYLPEVRAFATKLNTLEKYTDIEIPEDINISYSLCYTNDLFNVIDENINYDQFLDIESAIYSGIKYRIDANIAAATKQINEVYSAFENLNDKVSELFGAIDNDSISKLVGAIGDGGLGLNEDKLIKAIMNNKDSNK